MKALIVTSEITYIPKNCGPFFSKILKDSAPHIAGLIIVKNLSLDIFKKLVWLYFLGCRNIANSLARNILELPLQKRKTLFRQYNLPTMKVKSINDATFIDWVKENDIDLIINLRTRCKYKREILQAPRFGCVNIHHGILPKYKGLFCDLYALAEGRPAGFSIHQMNEQIDEGNIFYKKNVSYAKDLNYVKYLSKLGCEEANLITKLLNSIDKYKILPKGEKNYHKKPVITRTPNKEEIKKMQKQGITL